MQKGIGEYGDFSKKEASEEEVLGTIGKGHNAMSTVMSNRSKNLQIVRAMWTSGSTKVSMKMCHTRPSSLKILKCLECGLQQWSNYSKTCFINHINLKTICLLTLIFQGPLVSCFSYFVFPIDDHIKVSFL